MIKNFLEYVNESLYMGSSLYDFMQYLIKTKKNKVAFVLDKLTNSEAFPEISDINYIGTDKSFDMLSYLSKSRANTIKSTYYDNNSLYNASTRTSIRIGRGVRKIFDILKDKLKFKYGGKCRVLLSSSNANFVYLDLESDSLNSITDYFIIKDDASIYDVPYSKINIVINKDGKKLKFTGEVHYMKSYQECVSIRINDEVRSLLEDNFKFYTDMVYSSEYSRKSKSKEGKFKDLGRRNRLPIDTDINFEIITDLNINDSDIEKFSNELTSLIKSNKADSTSVIEVVKGEEIRKWYNDKNYQSKLGKLGNSCMSEPSKQRYLDIYVENSDVVSLLILKNTDDKLLGRALLWKTSEGEFLDRTYTIDDSDENILINYAIEKGYMYRSSGYELTYFKNGNRIPMPSLIVNLEKSDFEYYPYLDTIAFLDQSDSTLTNIEKYDLMKLKDTNGGWEGEEGEDYDDNYDDEEDYSEDDN